MTSKKSTRHNTITTVIIISVAVLALITNLSELFLNIECLYLNHSNSNINQPNFTVYQELLNKYVSGGRVDYQNTKSSSLLSRAINQLKQPVNLDTPEKYYSFWINAYNLMIIDTISKNYPVKTLKNLKMTFSRNKYIVAGQICSIQDVYNQKLLNIMVSQKNLKPIFLTCNGSLGWPKLSNRIVSPDTIYDDAETAIENYVNNKENVIFDAEKKTITISKFFQINLDYFQTLYGDPFNFVIEYYKYPHKDELYNIAIQKFYFTDFNWSINDAKNKVAK